MRQIIAGNQSKRKILIRMPSVLSQRKVAMTANINNKEKFIKYCLPVIIYAITIFYLSSIPGDSIPRYFSVQDLIVHTIEYAIFAFLIHRALKAYFSDCTSRTRFLWAFLLCFVYAASDEFHQSFVPGRNPSLYDLAYDSIGTLIASIFYVQRENRAFL